MRLTQFRVRNFRSVGDSGWVEVDRVTALIGVNESGKTNLLVPLWKLNPAREGEIQPTSDYPKKMFGKIRTAPEKFCFITADFETGEQQSHMAEVAGIDEAAAEVVRVSRYFDGTYAVEFPKLERRTTIPVADVKCALSELKDNIRSVTVLKKEGSLKREVEEVVATLLEGITEDAGPEDVAGLKQELTSVIPLKPAKTSSLVPHIHQTVDKLQGMHEDLRAPDLGEPVSGRGRQKAPEVRVLLQLWEP